MKGWFNENENILYVFPQTPNTIPNDCGATKIAVQTEDFNAWVTANSELADLLFKYNYNTITVNKKSWADHTNDDIPNKDIKPLPGLMWTLDGTTECGAQQVHVNADDNVYPYVLNPYSVEVIYGSDNSSVATINETTGEITLVGDGYTAISAVFVGDDNYQAQTVSYTIDVQKQLPGLAWSEESATVTIGADDNVYPTLTNPNYVAINEYVSTGGNIATVDPNGDVTLVAEGECDIIAVFNGDENYSAQQVSYHLTVNPAPASTVNLSVQHDMLGIGYIKVNNEEQTLDKSQTINLQVYPNDSIAFTLESGYTLHDVSNDDGSVQTTEDSGVYSFSMPSIDTWISIDAPQ